jgi:hypothetical protein
MKNHCVDVAFYWTPKEAAAIVDYLDRLRDTVWELYGDDIIGCRTKELDEQCDPRQQHLCFDNEVDQPHKMQAQRSTSYTCPGASVHESASVNENTVPRKALPSFDDLPTLSDENIGDMLNLLRALLQACEEHYKDPIRRLSEQRHSECLSEHGYELPTTSMNYWDEDSF